MMKTLCKTFALLCLALATTTLHAQNLIPPGDGEGLSPWTVTLGEARAEADGILLGANSQLEYRIRLEPDSRYRFEADLKTLSGSEDVIMRVRKHKTTLTSVASPLVTWTRKGVEFQTDSLAQEYILEFFKAQSVENNGAWIRNASLTRIGDATAEQRAGWGPLPKRRPIVSDGIAQQPNEKMEWFLDAKLGLFIHWGLYAGPGQGEWYMRNSAVPIDEYRKLAYPESGDRQFLADAFDAGEWAALAREAGCRYACLTTQHHDGYALFHSRYPDAFTSYNTHNRDFVREYVEAFRGAGLRVGLYKTLINWRYPGYYDVTGEDCQPNRWNYTTAAWHKESARQMKEELYCMTKELMSDYGKIDLIFWDGGWLAEKGSDADGGYFWEGGKFLDPQNQWPIDPKYTLLDEESGRPLGLMGMVRALQPDVICNIRSSWYGDYDNDEGGSEVTGPIRSDKVIEKCMSLHYAWGYTPVAEDRSKMVQLDYVKKMLADCVIRNMVLMLNVGPDRHGRITQAEADLLRALGKWIEPLSEAIYGTRGGPWNPEDNRFGFSYKGNRIYVWMLNGQGPQEAFRLPSLNKEYRVLSARELRSGRKLDCRKRRDGSYDIRGIEDKDSVATVIEVTLNRDIE